jgi:SAM-dependent methyltransferase
MRAGAVKIDGAADGSQRPQARESAHLDVGLRCPRCSANLSTLDCTKCWFHLHESGGVMHALPPERTEHYAKFVRDYELIRAAEGRGASSDDFYLGLPYHDASGKNGGQWRMRARSYEFLMKHILAPNLKAEERILDLGAGNCWMSFRLAVAGYRPYAVDLLTNSFDGLGVAERYRKYLPYLFPRFQAELARLPFQDQQFDAVVFNASFHYAEEVTAAVREALRCIKKGGLVVISDTPWYSCEESGNAMVRERCANFLQRYGTASASIESTEFLTDERLRNLEEALAIRWSVYSPKYGMRWQMRPIVAKLRHKREPATFRIYVTQKGSA